MGKVLAALWVTTVLMAAACSDSLSDLEPTAGSRPEADDQDLSALASASSLRARWTPLAGDQSPDPSDFLSGLSLSAAPRREPVLALSTLDSTTGSEATQVSRWTGSDWRKLGTDLPELGPSLGISSQGRLYVCTGSGPFVRRWNGTSFLAVGGDISAETGYRGTRYSVDACGGIVLDRSDAPLVAWTAHRGPKADSVHAARWSDSQARWEGLGADGIPVRATSVYLDIDAQDRPYAATFSPGGSYGGGATTRVFRFDSGSWTQLGNDLPATEGPVIGVYDDTPYLALRDNESGELRLFKWQRAGWQQLPTPGLGSGPAMAFSLSGKPLLAYITAGDTQVIRVAYRTGSAWHGVGDAVADVSGKSVSLGLTLDADGRPVVTFREEDPATGRFHAYVKRYERTLP